MAIEVDREDPFGTEAGRLLLLCNRFQIRSRAFSNGSKMQGQFFKIQCFFSNK